MKKMDLQPTKENLINTLCSDSIDRNESIISFINLLDTLEENYSISIEGSWGSGKTFFVKQIQMILDCCNENSYAVDTYNEDEKNKIMNILSDNTPSKSSITIYYDAWENDSDYDPILSIIFTIIQSYNLSDDFIEGKGLLNTISSIVSFISDKDINQLKENLEGRDFLEKIREAKHLKERINEFIGGLFAEHGDRLVIFIDELDRCRPSYAIELLERIKHYFTNERITFVFSTNIEQLQHTVKQIYGNNFDGCRYLDRFFDLRISIPPMNMQKFYDSMNIENQDWIIFEIALKVIKTFNLQMRETTKLLCVLNKIMESMKNSRDISVIGLKSIFVPIMLGVKLYDQTQYNEFIYGRNNAPLFKVIDLKYAEEVLSKYLLENHITADDKKLIDYNQRLLDLYNGVFNFDTDVRCMNVGIIKIYPKSKNMLIKITSLLE